jgi:hypothetical protein
VLLDLAELLRLATKSRSALVAENLFLRKQLALFQERSIKPHRTQDSAGNPGFIPHSAEVFGRPSWLVTFSWCSQPASASFMYVFVNMKLGRRQILHHNVTAHPSAEWTLQQFREALREEHPYRFLMDKAVAAMGVRMLKTPDHSWHLGSPAAHALVQVCHRMIFDNPRMTLPDAPDSMFSIAMSAANC